MPKVKITKGKFEGLNACADERGTQNIQALNNVLALYATPWWDIYGGRDNIEVITLS